MPRYFDDDDYDDLDIGRYRDRDDGPMPQSGLGIASLLMSIGCGVVMFALIAGAVIAESHNNGPVNDKDPLMMAIVLGILANCGFTLIGLVLGLVGCFQPSRGALCGILGSIFNGLILLGFGFLLCLAVIVGG